MCDHPGCVEAGVHRAPKSPQQLNSYFWFCLDHVREYNKAWNYCQGMGPGQIDVESRRASTWDRPTWPMGNWGARERELHDRVRRSFMDEEARAERANREQRRRDFQNPRPSRELDALRALEMDPAGPLDLDSIKKRYKELVKRHHPDANNGSREAEERFKTINEAYGVLKAALAS